MRHAFVCVEVASALMLQADGRMRRNSQRAMEAWDTTSPSVHKLFFCDSWPPAAINSSVSFHGRVRYCNTYAGDWLASCKGPGLMLPCEKHLQGDLQIICPNFVLPTSESAAGMSQAEVDDLLIAQILQRSMADDGWS